MSILSSRVARVRRLSRAWLRALRCHGLGPEAEGLGNRLARALTLLDALATTGPSARDAVVNARLGLQVILEQVEAMGEQSRAESQETS